jgi:hypothetical protein
MRSYFTRAPDGSTSQGALILASSRWERQPDTPVGLTSGLPIQAGYVLDGGFYRADRKSKEQPSANWIPSDEYGFQVLRATASGPTQRTAFGSCEWRSVLCLFSVSLGPINSVSGNQLLATIADGSAVEGSIQFGGSTGYLTDEVLSVLNGGRRGITEASYALNNGVHVAVFHWTGSTYEIWVDGRMPTQTEGGGSPSLITGVPYIGSRFSSGGPYASPIMFAVDSTGTVDLRQYQSNPWALFENVKRSAVPFISLPSRVTRQPRTIELSKTPYTKDIISVALPNGIGLYDLASFGCRGFVNDSAGVSLGGSSIGAGWKLNTAGSSYIRVGTKALRPANANEFTRLAIFIPGASGGTLSSGENFTCQWAVSGSEMRLVIQGVSELGNTSGAGLTQGVLACASVSYSGGQNVRLDHVNGRLVRNGTASASFSNPTEPNVIYGARNTSGSEVFDGTLLLHADWNVALSDLMLRELTANPWQLFRSPGPSRTIFIPNVPGVGVPRAKALATPALHLPSRVTRQPRTIEFNNTNPLTVGLASTFSANLGVSLINASPVTSPWWMPLSGGPCGLAANSTTGQIQYHAINAIKLKSGPFTIGAYVDVYSLANYSAILCAANGSNGIGGGIELRIGDGPTDSHICLIQSTATYYSIWRGSASNMLAAGIGHKVSVSSSGYLNDVPTFMVNGVPGSAGVLQYAGSNVLLDPPTTRETWIASRADLVTYFYGRIYLIAVWNRRLLDVEMLEWQRDPWQIFRELRCRTIFLPSPAQRMPKSAILVPQ